MSSTNTAIYVFSKLLNDQDFDYISKYDDIQIHNPNFTIFSYPTNIREIWYKFVPSLIRRYKNFAKKYDFKQLSDDLMRDNDLKFIPMELIDAESLEKQEFGKLLTEDYEFRNRDSLGKDYFKFSTLVKYSVGVLSDYPEVNVDYYLRCDLIKPETEAYNSILNLANLNKFLSFQQLNRLHQREGRIIGNTQQFLDRYYNKNLNIWEFEPVMEIKVKAIIEVLRAYGKLVKNFIYHEDIRKYLTSRSTDTTTTLIYWTQNTGEKHDEKFKYYAQNNNLSHKIQDINILNKLSDESLWCSYFDVCDFQIFNYILQNTHSNKIKLELFDDFMNCYSNEHGFVIMKTKEFLKLLIDICNEDNLNLVKFLNACSCIADPRSLILTHCRKYAEDYFEKMIMHKEVNKDNFKQKFEEWEIKPRENSTLGFTWVKKYHEEPPIEIYHSPNHNVSFENLADCWRKYVNNYTVPMEMISMKYWDYMIRSQGKKKNPNFTMCYTFFSNTDMNKIIFCKSDIELLEPARERMFIPIEYKKLKEYLHEDLKTNDICLFSHMTKDDFVKVAGGNDTIDMVVFSDSKNIYRDRTPPKEIIQYIKDNIELTFEVECDMIDN